MIRHTGLYMLLAALLVITPLATAQFPGRTPSLRTSPGTFSRTSISPGISRQAPGSASTRLTRSSSSLSGISGYASSRYNSPGGFGNATGSHSNNASGVLQQLFNQYQDHRYTFDRHKQEEEMAKAYRDAAIINAVAGLVGTLATVAINADCQAAQAPLQTVAPAPAGHYETRRVMIREARQEQYQVWIPPVYSQQTGQQIDGGYHEIRTRIIPALYQEQQVWVSP